MAADTRKLTLINLGNMKYGVWEDEILSIKDVRAIHWLPPVPEYIAGMSILNGDTATLFDFPACIGLSSVDKDKNSYFVLLTEQDTKKAGFIVDDIINKIPVPSDAVFPIPDYLKTPVIESCAIYESKPIPIVNISTLYSLVQKTDYVPYKSDLLSLKTRQDDCSAKNIRVFECSDETFAVSSDFIDTSPEKPGPISQLSLTPAYVGGMAFYNKSVLPLIHLSQLLNLSGDKSRETMLVANINGQDFGFLVDSDIGKLNSINYSLKPLPPVAQSCSIRKAAVYQKKIIPLIDLDVLLSGSADNLANNLTDNPTDNPTDNIDDSSLSGEYSTDSQFHLQFTNKEVEVLEFSLLGTRHALPKSEVEDSFNLKPFRYVPNIKPIIAGVAEHNGELLPVLDPAVCFQRESVVTSDWQMILIKNGNFRALVLTDTVFGPRRLSVKMQRDLPFEVPHTLVYGCYPDESSVRLIFNTQALAVHFDSQMFRKFFSYLEKEMSQEFEDIVPVIPPYLDTLKISETKETKEEIDKTHKVENSIGTEEVSESVDSDGSIETSGESSGESFDESSGESSGVSGGFDSTDKHEESDDSMHPKLSEDTANRLDAKEKEECNAETGKYLEIEQPENITANEDLEKSYIPEGSVSFIETEKGEEISFENELPESEEPDSLMSDRLEPETVQSENSEKYDSKPEVAESVFFSVKEDWVAFFDSVVLLERKEEIKLPENDETDTHLIKTTYEEKFALPEEKPDVAETANTEETEQKPPAEIAQQLYSPEPEPPAETSQKLSAQDNKKDISYNVELPQDLSEITSSEKPEKRLSRRVFAVLLIILLLVAGIYFSGLFKIKPGVKESNKRKDPVVVRKPVPAQVKTPEPLIPRTSLSTPSDSVVYNVKKGDTLYKIKDPVVVRKPVPAQIKTPKPLIPMTSLSTPSDSVVYNVKKGDTLYKITKRYTGDGWNYPKVARENKIPNPDLIFPDQKIKVPK